MVKGRVGILCALLVLVVGIIPAVQAQAPIVISVAVPEFVRDLVRDNIIIPFEEQNPDIKVNLVSVDIPFYNPADINAYLDSFQNYVSQADLVIVNETSISVEATRAGYLLDLAPLVRSDSTMNAADFYPQFWQSFQWDGAMWAIPAAGDVIGLLYDPAAFDNLGLTYPDEFWTLVEFENAIRALSEVDQTTGKVTKSAYLDFTTNGTAGILLSLAGEPIYDPNTFDAVPDFSNPLLETYLTDWKRMYDDGLFPPPGESGEINLNAPLVIGQSLFANFSIPGVEIERKVGPLPGGHSQLNINALAISAGSLYPEQAYRLIKFTTESAAITTAFLSALPARKSLVGVKADIQGSNFFTMFLSDASPEEVANLERLLAASYPQSQVMFTPYLSQALNQVNSGEKDARTALQDAGAAALDSIQIAKDRAANTVITVATPPPDVNVAAGEIELKFGIQTIFGNFPNQAEWQAAAEEFAANDPQVGTVTLESVSALSGGTLEETAEKYDCFYQTGNIVPTADLAQIRPLDPLFASDFSFDPNDIVGGALDQVRRENQIWAVPLNIRPQAFFYNPVMFNENGAFPPYPGWTTGDFESALRAIKVDPDDPAPFSPRDLNGNGTYLLLLMAAYGGLPVDYTTNPPTVRFTDESSVQAIQQVLDLAKDGYIEYTPLAQTGGRIIFGNADDIVAMYTQILNAFGVGNINEDETDSGSQYEVTLFPQGIVYTAVAYDLGTGYISVNTPHVEACYRFLTYLMRKPDLYGGMPVLRSLINSPEVMNTQGQATVDFYNAMDTLIQTPGAVVLQTGMDANAGGETLIIFWLYQTFDKYVADDSTDLAFELGEAELFANAYLECLALIPAEEKVSGNLFDRYRQWRECAIKVDPAMEQLLPAF